MKKIFIILGKAILPIFVLSLVAIFWFGSENKQDPDWIKYRDLNPSHIVTLKMSEWELQKSLVSFHHKSFRNKKLAIELVSDPFPPAMEIEKFKYFLELLKEKKKIVISSVSGSGASTLIDRLSKIVSPNPNGILNIKCAPQFDLIYHNKYIGDENNTIFAKGELLQLWDKCLSNPNEKFIAIFDSFDKINPETFFGPQIWEKLSSPNKKVFWRNEEIIIPDNFYMITSTLSGIGSLVKFNNDHFKRLGTQYFLRPSTVELALYLNDKKKELNRKLSSQHKSEITEEIEKQAAALNDEKNFHKVLYFFEKVNDLIYEKYSRGHQLGQWNNLRKLFQPHQLSEMMQTFINHVNATTPLDKLTIFNFADIFYSIEHNGKIKNSNSVSTSFQVFKDWGFFTESVVALSFAFLTALFSAYMVRKRKKHITKYLSHSEDIYSKFVDRKLHTDEAIDQLTELRTEIEKDAKNGKISFPEAVFFYNSIRGKTHAIEVSKNVNESFLLLMDVFLEDEILSKSEYKKLNEFLNKIKLKIPKEDFIIMKEKVETAWESYGEKD